MITLAALAAAFATWLLVDQLGEVAKIRLNRDAGNLQAVWRFVLLVVSGFAGSYLGLIGFVLAVTVAAVTIFSARQIRMARQRKLRQLRRSQMAEAFEVLSADLSAGTVPLIALRRLGAEIDLFAPVAQVASWGGDVAEAMRASDPVLRDLAAAWQVAEDSGAGLALTLSHISQTLDEDREAQREIEMSLSPAQATARTLAVLPIIAIVFGTLVGYDPIGVITTTLVGSFSFATGCGFAMLGVWWVDQLAQKAGA